MSVQVPYVLAAASVALAVLAACTAMRPGSVLPAVAAIAAGHIARLRRGGLAPSGARRLALPALVLAYGALGVGAYRAVVQTATWLQIRAAPSEVRPILARLGNATATDAFAAATLELSEGRQADAERLLAVLVRWYPRDQRIAFSQAVCTRSRWKTRAARVQLERVRSLGRTTPYGTCAGLMLDIDRGLDDVAPLTDLVHNAVQSGEDPFLHWAAGIQCRDHYHRTRNTDFSERGMVMYWVALKHFGRGPVMVHHTLANILSDELHRHEEALEHRRTAVAMERAPWSLQGLATTLSFLGQFEEANAYFVEITTSAPDNCGFWHTYADSLRRERRHEDCIEVAQRMLALDPGSVAARIRWAQSLEDLGRRREALDKYREALALDSSDETARGGIRRLSGGASP